ncbi:MAG: response regulator [Rhodocyclaceae bacterium]
MSAATSTPGKRVLLVDDNPDAVESLALLLDMFGFDVRTATTGTAGLTMGRDFRPDVVLLDIAMPTIDGYETCRQMRATEWGAPIRIIAMTGWSQDSDRQRSREAGFSAHLVKPVEPDALMALLEPRQDGGACT